MTSTNNSETNTIIEEPEGPENYRELMKRYRQVAGLEQASLFLKWDQRVMMPEEGTPSRAKQMSTISTTSHELLTDDKIGELLDEIDNANLTDEQISNTTEIRRKYRRSVRVPAALTGEITEAASKNQRVWQNAKEEDDYDSFAPRLDRLRDLHVERARSINSAKDPYEVMFEDSHPYMDMDNVEQVLDTLRKDIPPIVDTIRKSDVELPTIEEPSDEVTQREICERALDFLGLDRSRSRLDTSSHRFMIGNPFDTRITTRFNEGNPIDPLTGTIHEFGHATYQLGLPKEKYATPVGESLDSIHESQSRFWENHIGRSQAFWEAFLPKINELNGFDVTPREAYEAVNRIHPDNLIRVEADELTYHLHIVLRSEIGRMFVEGDIDVGEIPSVWNNKMHEYLGVRPDTDTEGCLQDIHWTKRFAAFETYTIGSVLAAQLDATIREELNVDELVRNGTFEPIHEWMTTNIHRHGKRYPTPDLIEQVTGEPLTAEYFLDYIREKISDIYNIAL